MRISEVETLEDGSECKRTISGNGVIIHIRPDVVGMKPSDARRDFKRKAQRLGVVWEPCERSHGHYAHDGKAIVEGLESAYRCVGSIAGLTELVKHAAVADWHFAVGGVTVRGATGSGPEKVRPASGSVFGKPATVKGTATALATATANRVRAFQMNAS